MFRTGGFSEVLNRSRPDVGCAVATHDGDHCGPTSRGHLDADGPLRVGLVPCRFSPVNSCTSAGPLLRSSRWPPRLPATTPAERLTRGFAVTQLVVVVLCPMWANPQSSATPETLLGSHQFGAHPLHVQGAQIVHRADAPELHAASAASVEASNAHRLSGPIDPRRSAHGRVLASRGGWGGHGAAGWCSERPQPPRLPQRGRAWQTQWRSL